MKRIFAGILLISIMITTPLISYGDNISTEGIKSLSLEKAIGRE